MKAGAVRRGAAGALLAGLLILISFAPVAIRTPAATVAPPVAEAQPGWGIVQRVIDTLARYYPRFDRFIRSNVASLLSQGATQIQRAYVSIGRQIIAHEAKLRDAQAVARRNPTPYNKGLVQYYEKELQRFRTEHEILRRAMELMGIRVP